MIFYSEDFIDRLIREDLPVFDLTCRTLGVAEQPGKLTFVARESMVMAGGGVVRRILDRLGLAASSVLADGTVAAPGDVLLEGRGTAEALHAAWKVSLNVLEVCGGIATRTRRLVEAAKAVNPSVEIATTRKNFPGTKELAITGIMAGGALPHRLGLSETILVFEQHRVFCGGMGGLVARLPSWRKQVAEKMVIVEVASLEEARQVAGAGAAGVQFDKVPVNVLRGWVEHLKAEHPRLVLIAAGGINEANTAGYAGTGVDVLATSSVYFGRPADIKAFMTEA